MIQKTYSLRVSWYYRSYVKVVMCMFLMITLNVLIGRSLKVVSTRPGNSLEHSADNLAKSIGWLGVIGRAKSS